MSVALYDRIGVGYDVTRRADPHITATLARHLHLAPGNELYLDIACGTGNYTTALSQHGGRWVGLDKARTMLEQAREKASLPSWHCGDVDRLPYTTGTFVGAICVLAVHHFVSLPAAIQEVHRILRPGGQFVLFTSTREQMRHYWLWEYFPEAMQRSAEEMPHLDSIKQAMWGAEFQITGVDDYKIREDLRDFFLYCGKHRPQLYLNERVRRGISTFSSLASPVEVEQGVERLRADVESKRIREVQAAFKSREGDYCFISALKRR